MSDTTLAREPDFSLGALRLSPSTCQAFDGERAIRVEAQTMSVLIVLARTGGATITREDLVKACWQGRIVSDDAIARAIAKVRALARETAPPAFTLHTVPKVGYRLITAETEARPRPASALLSQVMQAPRPQFALAAIATVILIWGATAMVHGPTPASATVSPPLSAAPPAAQVYDALMMADPERLAFYVRSGWNANWQLDSEGNTALHILPQACERNPRGHDQQSVLRIAQMLVAAGGLTTTRNKWNDTPLTISASPRYCGPNHPLTAYLRTLAIEAPASRPSGDE